MKVYNKHEPTLQSETISKNFLNINISTHKKLDNLAYETSQKNCQIVNSTNIREH